MKKIASSVALLLLASQSSVAQKPTGLFFNTTSQNELLTVTTNVPNHPAPYPYAGIQVVSPGYHLADPYTECESFDGNMCLFSASNTIPKTFTISGPVGPANIKLCLDGANRLTCQHYTHHVATQFPTQIAYVVSSSQNAQNQGYVTSCPVLSNGLLGTACVLSASSNLVSPQSITFNAAGTMAYIANYGNGTVANCPVIDRVTGQLGACTSNGGNFAFGHYLLGAVGVTDSYVYVPVNESNQIMSCPVLSDGSLGVCVDSGATATFPVGMSGPSSINTQAPGSPIVTMPGLLSASPLTGVNVLACSVAGSNLSCNSPSPDSFNGPLSFSRNTFAYYVANGNNSTISYCPVGGCIVSPQPFNFGTLAEGPVVNIDMHEPLFGYIPNAANDNVSVCSINQGNGALDTCTTQGSTGSPYYFITPTGVTILDL